jgi:acetyltransferase-like isoleucine patch superfamily enzyme
MKKKQNICVFGFKDSSAGQLNSWLEEFSEYRISFFISVIPLKKEKLSEKKMNVYKKKEYLEDNRIFNKNVYFLKDYIKILNEKKIKKCIIIEDNSYLRKKIYLNLKKNNFQIISFIHPTVNLNSNVDIGEGTIIFPRCNIGYKTSVGKCCMIQSNCNIEHHNYVSDFVNLNPCVNTGGFSEIGMHADIKMSVNIINKIIIEENCLIGAGSLVLKNCRKNSLYFGSPAKFIKKSK